MFNEDMEQLLQELVDKIHHSRISARRRAYLELLYRHATDARRSYEDRIQELEMLLLRNPAFPGDIMGVWDDEIPEDETLTDEEDEQ